MNPIIIAIKIITNINLCLSERSLISIIGSAINKPIRNSPIPPIRTDDADDAEAPGSDEDEAPAPGAEDAVSRDGTPIGD